MVTEALVQRGIAPQRITAVEFDPDFADCVRERCPGVSVIEGDAFNLTKTLGQANGAGYAAVVSGIPLLNWPMEARRGLIEDAFRRLQPGAPFIQFSYGFMPPVPANEGFSVTRAAVIWANLPPARVWVYSPR